MFAAGTVVGEASGGLVGVFCSSLLTDVGVAAEFSAAAFFSSSALSAAALAVFYEAATAAGLFFFLFFVY